MNSLKRLFFTKIIAINIIVIKTTNKVVVSSIKCYQLSDHNHLTVQVLFCVLSKDVLNVSIGTFS